MGRAIDRNFWTRLHRVLVACTATQNFGWVQDKRFSIVQKLANILRFPSNVINENGTENRKMK